MEQFYRGSLEEIRRRQYPMLDDVTYLDHAGTTLYAQSLVDKFAEDMKANIFGNPHSASPSSALSTNRVEDARSRLLSFFNADPEHYDLVFVANCTAAVKLVVDAFRDVHGGFWYGYHRDGHTSIVGPRQLARESRCFTSDDEVERWIDGKSSTPQIPTKLFAYPAQSNMNGHRTPLDWSARIRRASPEKIYTLLDAAAYVMTAPLDLSDVDSAPDFTAFSLYKIFGFPDLGALIVRKCAGDVLRRRRYFGGGTVDMVISLQQPWHATKTDQLHETLEDGTLPFHSIVALNPALDVFRDLYGSMSNVSKHTRSLALNMYERLASLRHFNDVPVCEIYKDVKSQYGNAKTQGPTIALNLRNSQGGWIGKSEVEKLAILHGIHLRTGGVCNPGGIATFCNLDAWEMRRNFSEGMRCGDDLDILGGKPTGIIRVSLGAMSSINDVDAFIDFIVNVFVEKEDLFAHSVSVSTSELTVSKLQIFPIAGCAGWEIPKDQSWSFDSAGLTYDREWCVISLECGQQLDSESHPVLRGIRPSLLPEQGLLRIEAPRDGLVSELTVSLWEDPPPGSPVIGLTTADRRPADGYLSLEIKNYFTSLLGVPCTLARYQHPQRVSNAHGSGRQARPTSFSRGITAVFDSGHHDLGEANITVSHPPRMPPRSQTYSQHVRVGPHSFLAGFVAQRVDFSQQATLQYVRNLNDRTSSAQNPTLRVGDVVEAVSAPEGTLLKSGAVVCPVWNCRRSYELRSSLDEHLDSHTTSPRPILPPLIEETKVNMWSSKQSSHSPKLSTSTTNTTSTAVTKNSLESVASTDTDMTIHVPAVQQIFAIDELEDNSVPKVIAVEIPTSAHTSIDESKPQKHWTALKRKLRRLLSCF